MTVERGLAAEVADLAAVIERVSADLAVGEEPSGFLAALEEHAPPTPDPASTPTAP